MKHILELDAIQRDFKAFEQSFPLHFESGEAVLNNIISHYLHAKGKQLRPLFYMVLHHGVTGLDNNRPAIGPNVCKQLCALEMTHMATLLHDDVIDQANIRRHQPSVRSKWGNALSILTGDFLSSRAFMLLDEKRISLAFAKCMNTMTEGEIAQSYLSYDINLSADTYFRIIEKKTAVLFELAAMMLAINCTLDAKKASALKQYAHYFGMAFQLLDDIKDYQANNAGKPRMQDLKEGKITLPLLWGMADSEPLKQKVAACLQGHNNQDMRHEILQHLRRTPGLERCQQQAQKWAQKAEGVLQKAELSVPQTHFLMGLFVSISTM